MALRLTRQAPSVAALSALESTLTFFRIPQPLFSLASRRHASHQAQGRANGARDGPGKRLGAKRGAGEYVVTGSIIYKQRGTLWFPGDNCFMGRDHTIHAAIPGYVTYYRDPARHPKRKYIGLVFERHQSLPQPPGQPRRRKLGMLAYQMPRTEGVITSDLTTAIPPNPDDIAQSAIGIRQQPNEFRGVKLVRKNNGDTQEIKLHLRPGGQYREANWEIGRAAEQSKAAQAVKPFKPGDRFAAWRKAAARRSRNAERRSIVGNKKSKAKRK